MKQFEVAGHATASKSPLLGGAGGLGLGLADQTGKVLAATARTSMIPNVENTSVITIASKPTVPNQPVPRTPPCRTTPRSPGIYEERTPSPHQELQREATLVP